jgi:hypothetical protein
MLVIRATRKLLNQLGQPVTDPPVSTTVLGDWYAKPFSVARRRFILLISEKSRLAALMPGRDVAHLPKNLPEAIKRQLVRLGVPPEAVAREIKECGDVVVATTASKSLLGTLNDYAYIAKLRIADQVEVDLDDEAFSLSHTPLSPLKYKYAAEKTLRLFDIEPWRIRV